MITNKICPKCNISKLIVEFYRSSSTKDGYRCWCKACSKLDNSKREPNYNQKRKEYRVANQKEYRENKKSYYKKNKDKLLESNKSWRQTINGKFLMYKRGAKARNLTFELTKEEFSTFWGLYCYYCNDKIETIGIDRIVSSKGYILNNIVPCCSICNVMKLNHDKQFFINHIQKIWENLEKLKVIY